MSKPRVKEINVQFGGGGKVTIRDYGKIAENYSASISERIELPDDWTEEEIAEFEIHKIKEIREKLAPVLQEEFNAIYNNPARDWE